MTSQNWQRRQLSILKAWETARKTFPLTWWVRTTTKCIAVVCAISLAISLVGLGPALSAFLTSHNIQIGKAYGVFLLLYPLFVAFGEMLSAFLYGLFGLSHKETKRWEKSVTS